MGGMDQVWIKTQLAGMTLGPAVWLAGWPPEPGSLLEEGAMMPACYSRHGGQEKGCRHRSVFLVTICCFCSACVVGASLFTLQPWQCMAKGCMGPQGVADQARGDWFIGLLRHEKERFPAPPISHPKLSQIVMSHPRDSSAPSL